MAAVLDLEAESLRLDSRKPYLELIDGIELRKMSPQMRHGQIQVELAFLIRTWATGRRGVVVSEARFWLDINPATATSLLPDVAYVSSERLVGLSKDDKQRPPFAPDLAIEIRSPGDRERNIARKVELYLDRGARLVLDVDPKREQIVAHDGTSTIIFAAGETLEHEAFPGLKLDVEAVFAAGNPPA